MQNTPSLTINERRIFARRPPMLVSAWAARHLIVPDGPYRGARYRPDVNPYLRGIMDCWGQADVEEVITCGSAQTGKTLILYACICYGIDMRPGPRMLAMPDDATLTRIVEAKLRPLLRGTRPVASILGKIRSDRIQFRDATMLHLSSAASPSQRASISVRDLFLDEEALFAQIQGKGVPVLDFLERTRSYRYSKKILRVSKPVGGEECSIVADLALMDEVRHYHVICPGCGTAQIMNDAHIVTEHNVKDAARITRESLGRYRCPHCKLRWTDYMRDQAVARGYWAAETPVHQPRRVGFHLPAVLSYAVSLSEVAAAKAALETEDDQEKHQAYVNGYWARPYKPVVKATREDTVLELIDKELPPQVLPRSHVAITTYIDMQKRGFWYLTCAWTPRLGCAFMDYGRLAEWDDVRRYVFDSTFRAEDGGEPAIIWRAGLDTGGTRREADAEMATRTEEAYAFIKKYGGETLFATKGNAHRQFNPVQWNVIERMPKSRAAIAGGLRLFLLDTYYLKSLATGRLHPDARQPFRLHRDCKGDLARQLAAEELVREKGRMVWRRRHKDNHLFDCLVGNLALVHPSWTPSLMQLTGHLDDDTDTPQTCTA